MLITMAIIGVVSAVIMPVLINYLSGSYIRQAQEMYSVVTKIVRGAENNAGPIQSWPDYLCADEEFFKEYIEPQMKYTIKVSKPSYTMPECPPELAHMCTNSSDKVFDHYDSSKAQVYLLANGAALGFYTTRANSTFIVFDVNGVEEPNRTGVDIYVMSLITTNDFEVGGELLPFGFNPVGIGLDKEEQIKFCKKSSTVNPFWVPYNNMTCLSVLVNNGFTDKNYPIKSWGK